MALLEHTIDEHVAILTMNSGENLFAPLFIEAFLAKLEEIERTTDATTLVVTAAHEKIFSNGIDLAWLQPICNQGDTVVVESFLASLNHLFTRILTYPLVTVAAMNGHAFAGGAILACAFDFRFMRSDRGYFCLPEVDLGIAFLPGMNAILGKAIPRYQLEMLQYTGIRLTAAQCLEHHIITRACHMNDLMPESIAFAKTINKKRTAVGALKQRLNKDIVHTMKTQDPHFFSPDALIAD